MGKSFQEKISQLLRQGELIAPVDLAEKIVIRIRKKERLNALVKTASFGVLTVLAIVLSVFTWRAQSSVIINSEAIKLLSLAFSDTAIILSYWKEYSLSLLESIPFVSVAFLAACLWIVFASAHIAIKNSKVLFNNAFRRV